VQCKWVICAYVLSTSFFSWCRIHWLVGDSDQPVSVWCQYQHTEDNNVNARLSELMDLPRVTGRRSSSLSKSLVYRIKNALISTDSVISNGRSFSVYSRTLEHQLDFTPDILIQVYLIHLYYKLTLSNYVLSNFLWTKSSTQQSPSGMSFRLCEKWVLLD